MQSQEQASWNSGRAYYRCKFPAQYAITAAQHPKTVSVREQAIVPSLDEWTGSLFAEEHPDATCEALPAVSDLEPPDDQGRELELRRRLKECDAKLAKYKTEGCTWPQDRVYSGIVSEERVGPYVHAGTSCDSQHRVDETSRSATASVDRAGGNYPLTSLPGDG